MTIAALTTFGFITGSTVSRAVTLGYGGGTSPTSPTDTHDLPRRITTPSEARRLREKAKQAAEKREKAYAEKLEAANSIRLEIDRIMYPERFVVSDTKAETVNDAKPLAIPLPDLAKLTAKQREKITDLRRQVGVLMAEAHILEEQNRAAAREYRKQRDEVDMQVIAALYNQGLTRILH